MSRNIIVGTLALCSLSMSSAIAGPIINCVWDDNFSFPLMTYGFSEIVYDAITKKVEEYNCDPETGKCDKREYYLLANKVFTVTSSNTVSCINNGDAVGDINFLFYISPGPAETNFRGPKMVVAGGPTILLDGSSAGSTINWKNGSLAPCQRDCRNVKTGWPRFDKTLSLTFTATPISLRADFIDKLEWNKQNHVGNWAVDSLTSSVIARAVPVCIMKKGDSSCSQYAGGMGGGGGLLPPPPPVPQCTLRITTPNVIQFQPISSDDLSRNRVRMEDFTLTATKGPVQSQFCTGNVYNLAGEIKAEGGYAINSTFWGINHSSGSPQGIGLKIFDLDQGSYLQFNYRYPSFIKNIKDTSETKRFRAEIAASTNDLKKIKAGEYSQVLTFEVRMP